MSYTKITDFAIKDTYLTGNPAKVVKGAEIDAEFNAIEANFNGIGPLGTAAAAAVTTSATDTTAGSILTVGADISSQTTGVLSVARGGTGASDAATARTNLGLGTAATATVTTSATDTTANRLLKVGDFGLGGNTPQMYETSLDTLLGQGTRWVGVYTMNVAACNGPPGATGGVVQHIHFGTVEAVQIYTQASGSTRQWIRFAAATWQPWVEVWTTSNLVKTASATDTTAGRVTKVGDFGIGSDGATVVTDCNLPQPNGIYRTLDTTLNTPHLGGYYNLLYMSFGAQKSQLAQDAFNNTMYLRNYNGSAWSPWVEVATSANSLGQSQSWQDVSGSRVSGTNYTNSTGRPIVVTVAAYTIEGGSYNSALQVNEVTIDSKSMSANGTAMDPGGTTVSAIVPHGSTYRHFLFAGTIGTWMELR